MLGNPKFAHGISSNSSFRKSPMRILRAVVSGNAISCSHQLTVEVTENKTLQALRRIPSLLPVTRA